MIRPWFQFFRFVNLPTVPGDVLVGAAAGLAGAGGAAGARALPLLGAVLAACAIYLFGLADNDIVGAKTDGPERPIPSGAISLRAARIARGLCLFAALAVGSALNLPSGWWIAAFLLAVAVVAYNRTKLSVLMGLCRGLNVLCGGSVVAGGALGDRALPLGVGSYGSALPLGVGSYGSALPLGVGSYGSALPLGVGSYGSALPLWGVSLLWIFYITAVTRYSCGEEVDPAKRRRVGFLVGALVYLQLGALLCAYFAAPCLPTRNLLLVGAGLLVVLRVMKRAFPSVSAS